MKLKTKIIIAIIVVLIAMQFIRIDKTNPPVNPQTDFINVVEVPEHIKTLIRTSCYDCHSNETVYPWYSNIAPVSWWMKGHVNHAREEMNFSIWGKYSEKRKDHKLEEIIELVEEGEMPLPSYLIIHGEAKLDKEQIQTFTEWIQEQR